jgi:hypothetical protein
MKHNFAAVFQCLYELRGRGFSRLNQALLTLLPKRADAICLGDYKPISLIHLIRAGDVILFCHPTDAMAVREILRLFGASGVPLACASILPRAQRP